MPKRVDHDQRRTLIADALVRVAADQGLEAVSLRHVATAAGVSSGMVQHYFRTKDEMMRFALAVVRERHQLRVSEAVGRLGPDPAPRDLLRALFLTVLPLDPESRAYGRVGLAFLAYTAVRPEAAEPLRADTRDMLDLVTGLIRGANRAVDPAGAAAGLLAVLEGLGVYLLGGHYSAESAVAALEAQLDMIFGPQSPEK
ncbi:TetR/AcrR family transcriptional regulator [Jidongwangia harbinensis]|uniref:TetR/AcrR family transcriptional regulator n=1 Tax=Jidongwangia harbinensis TaxID=2878561 RepID=UPI001CDA275B|nr:TetR/AcrR family transcriptional regulator [Jidongwangia harbinensis]MCA2214476.1 TetR/AcrR family transcriptional regulator [Jidongwangia harbinensis]